MSDMEIDVVYLNVRDEDGEMMQFSPAPGMAVNAHDDVTLAIWVRRQGDRRGCQKLLIPWSSVAWVELDEWWRDTA